MRIRLVFIVAVLTFALTACSTAGPRPASPVPTPPQPLTELLLNVDDLGDGWIRTFAHSDDNVVIDSSTFVAACDTEYLWALASPVGREMAMRRFETEDLILTLTIVGGVSDEQFDGLITLVKACDGALASSWAGDVPVAVQTSLSSAPADLAVLTRLVVSAEGWTTSADQAFARTPNNSVLIARLTFVAGTTQHDDVILTAIERARAGW